MRIGQIVYLKKKEKKPKNLSSAINAMITKVTKNYITLVINFDNYKEIKFDKKFIQDNGHPKYLIFIDYRGLQEFEKKEKSFLKIREFFNDKSNIEKLPENDIFSIEKIIEK